MVFIPGEGRWKRRTSRALSKEDKDLDNISVQVAQSKEPSAEEASPLSVRRTWQSRKTQAGAPTGTVCVQHRLFACRKSFGLNIF